MTHRDGFPHASRLGLSARSAWRGDARHRKPCGTPSAPWPKALGSRRSGRAGEPAAGEWEGVGKPCRCPASPAASLLPGGSPARSLWVIIKDLWYYAKGQLGPGSFICSGFVQYGFYDAVRRLVDADRLTDAELAEVVFNPKASAPPDTPTLLSTTPEDLAQAEQLSGKYGIIDQHVYEVTCKTEAYALIARKGIRHQAPG